MKRSQTATEYLIILAVVIIIALIVVGVIGGIPSIGGGTSEREKKAEELTNNIGISSSAVYNCGTKLTVRNNNPYATTVKDLIVNGTECNSTELPTQLGIGESKIIDCARICSNVGSRYSYPLQIEWKSEDNTLFVQNSTIAGVVGTSNLTDSAQQELECTENSDCASNYCHNNVCSVLTESLCNDWLDNDDDNLFDCMDSDCFNDSECSSLPSLNDLVDERDGQSYSYREVSSSLRVMTQNLNYESEGSYCYDDDPANCEKFGRLYDISVINSDICPAGWRLLTQEEWEDLGVVLGEPLPPELSFTRGSGKRQDGVYYCGDPQGCYQGYVWATDHNIVAFSYHVDMWTNEFRSSSYSVRCGQDY